jgi:hypothetical protein
VDNAYFFVSCSVTLRIVPFGGDEEKLAGQGYDIIQPKDVQVHLAFMTVVIPPQSEELLQKLKVGNAGLSLDICRTFQVRGKTVAFVSEKHNFKQTICCCFYFFKYIYLLISG